MHIQNQPKQTPIARGNTPSQPSPQEDGKFTIDDIICPFQRAAYNEGELKADAEGNVTNLPEVLRKFAGASRVMTAVAHQAAKKMTHGGEIAAWKADGYNLQSLAGSHLDHTGDTQILRGGFNEDRLKRALSFSSDGENLTLGDLRSYQQANLEEEPGRRGEIFGGAEFALLVKVFGQTGDDGTKYIRNQDFVRLYRDAKWPEGWQPPDANSMNVWSTAKDVIGYFGDDNAKGPSKGGCPFHQG
jgi:hypothetical protein